MLAVVSAEWVKLRSVRSTYYLLAVAIVTIALGAWLAHNGAQAWDGLSPERRARFQAPAMEQALLPAVQLAMAVLGVLVMTSEHASGLIRTTLQAVPRRPLVLVGKALVVGALTLAVGTASVVGTFLAARAIVGDRAMEPGYTTAAADEVPLLLASGLSVLVFALVGLGLGPLLRSAAGAIVGIVALLFVLPTVARMVPEPWGERLGSVLLPNLPGQLVDHASATGVLPPVGAALVMTAYAALALGAAAVVLTGRDV